MDDQGEAAHAALLAAIGKALRLRGPFREHLPPWRRGDFSGTGGNPPDGHWTEVVAGTVDTAYRQVAWVERHTFPQEKDDDWINVWLHLAGKGAAARVPKIRGWVYARKPRPRVAYHFVHDRADRLTGVPYLWLHDDELIAVYTMAWGRRYLLRLTLGGIDLKGVMGERRDLGRACAVVEETTYWGARERRLCALPPEPWDGPDNALVRTLRLPDLTPEVPLPAPEPAGTDYAWDRSLRPDPGGGAVWCVERRHDVPGERVVRLGLPSSLQRGYPDDPGLLWERLRAALGGPGVPADGPDILIGAVATPFWDASQPVRRPGDAGRPLPFPLGPWWFPAAWYHHLTAPAAEDGAARPDEAAGWLAWLDRLAADADPLSHTGWAPNWSREEGITRLALDHLRHGAGTLATACRAGRLPSGDAIGRYWEGKWSYPQPVSAFPAGFGRAWRSLPKRFVPGNFPVGD